jgi:hypothetical protein
LSIPYISSLYSSELIERLGDDELIIIAKKVANFGARHLLELLFTSKKFARIYKVPILLRALPPEYANWIDSDALNLNQVNFFQPDDR